MCFFFAFNNFVLAFATDQLQPQSAEPRPAAAAHQPPAPWPRLAAAALQPPAPRPRLDATSHATQRLRHGPTLPLNGTAVPWPIHGPRRVCQGGHNRPPVATYHAMQRPHHGPRLPLNAAAAPWPHHGPGRVCQGRCRSWSAAPSHSHTAATLKIKGKNQKIICPSMCSNPTPLGRSKSISTTRKPPLMWYVVLFKFTYNCPFVNNVYSITLSKLWTRLT
jgi:hypothetical protein